MTGFVPDDFDPPQGLSAAALRLEPLGPQHNEADYAAWTSSMQHIHDTPGFATSRWPHEMTIDRTATTCSATSATSRPAPASRTRCSVTTMT